MDLPPGLRWTLRVFMWIGLAFLYVPLLLVLLNAFNKSRTFAFPPTGLTLEWWRAAANSGGARNALGTSIRAAIGATAIALVLGTMAAFAVQRYHFFGRTSISFLVILPIALPGIVTGIALNAAFRTVLDPLGIGFGLTTVIIGHATFCIVLVYNNVQARLRRMGGSLEEASADLGATGWQTFRMVTLPNMRGALLAGALLGVRAELRRNRGHDIHVQSRRADAAPLDLRQPFPAQSGPSRQRGRGCADHRRRAPGLVRAAPRRRRRCIQPPLVRLSPVDCEAPHLVPAGVSTAPPATPFCRVA